MLRLYCYKLLLVVCFEWKDTKNWISIFFKRVWMIFLVLCYEKNYQLALFSITIFLFLPHCGLKVQKCLTSELVTLDYCVFNSTACQKMQFFCPSYQKTRKSKIFPNRNMRYLTCNMQKAISNCPKTTFKAIALCMVWFYYYCKNIWIFFQIF